MKNKLTSNSNWYSSDFHEIIYVRTQIEGKILIYMAIKLRKKSRRLFITIEKIFDVLWLMYDDLNCKINAMKTFKRFKQTNIFKNFIMFWAEFQRLSIDAEMNNIEILLKDLKNKMSYDFQKTMIVDVYESIDLYAFAKKCQFMNQIFRDIENRSRFSRSMINEEIITTNEDTAFAVNKTIIFAIVTSFFWQITSTSRFFIISSISFKTISQQSIEFTQINVMKCYNCQKMNHIFCFCFESFIVATQGVVIKKIITEDAENEKSRKE